MMTETQLQLQELVAKMARDIGTEHQFALRDILTDLPHVSDHMELDWDLALQGSLEVYCEELKD